jgi:hypothetical protein
MIKTPGFLVFRDEVYIAENGAGYKTANMKIARFPFPVVQAKEEPATGNPPLRFFLLTG